MECIIVDGDDFRWDDQLFLPIKAAIESILSNGYDVISQGHRRIICPCGAIGMELICADPRNSAGDHDLGDILELRMMHPRGTSNLFIVLHNSGAGRLADCQLDTVNGPVDPSVIAFGLCIGGIRFPDPDGDYRNGLEQTDEGAQYGDLPLRAHPDRIACYGRCSSHSNQPHGTMIAIR